MVDVSFFFLNMNKHTKTRTDNTERFCCFDRAKTPQTPNKPKESSWRDFRDSVRPPPQSDKRIDYSKLTIFKPTERKEKKNVFMTDKTVMPKRVMKLFCSPQGQKETNEQTSPEEKKEGETDTRMRWNKGVKWDKMEQVPCNGSTGLLCFCTDNTTRDFIF